MDAYRKPGKRKKVPRKLRSWFIQNADGTEKGPFEYESLISSGKAERIKPSTLVRPEDEKEWQPLSDLLAVEAKKAAKKSAADVESYYAPRVDEQELGSFGAGLCAGLFGGLIGFVLVTVIARGRETKRGARWGLILQFTLGIVFRLFLASLPASSGY
jgi:hypothetical protein